MARRSAKRLLDMQSRPVFGGVLRQKCQQNNAAAKHRHPPQIPRTSPLGFAQSVDPPVAFKTRQRHDARHHRHTAHHPCGRPAGRSHHTRHYRPPSIAKGIPRMAQVHQRLTARIFQRCHAGIHQHIRQPRARPARQHGDRKQPDLRGMSGQQKCRTHHQSRQRQRRPPPGRPNRGGHKHGQNSSNRRHEQQRPQARLIHIQHGFDIGQAGCECPPKHTHRGKGGQRRTGDDQQRHETHLGGPFYGISTVWLRAKVTLGWGITKHDVGEAQTAV